MTIRIQASFLAVATMLGIAAGQAQAQVAAPRQAPSDAAANAGTELAAMRAQMEAMARRIAALETQLAAQQGSGMRTTGEAKPVQLATAQASQQPLPGTSATSPANTGGAATARTASASPSAKKASSALTIRGYTQLRYSQIVSGDAEAPAGRSRLRSVQDSAIGPDTNFSIRRIRLVFQGDVGHGISYYLQPDFATAVNNQSSGERRENFLQLRDAYVDIALDRQHAFKLRLGQSKVPFGWENLQSSSNRIPLDRTDGINSAVPSERDIGAVIYYTPPAVQAIWDDLSADGQKLFGNYGAFALGVFNGQGVNRPERNASVMTVAMATWPFRLDGLGLDGQVAEFGGALLRNTYQPELRSGGVSEVGFDERRVGIHAMLYPKPFGLQAEWNWGRGPQFSQASQSIETSSLNGGYVMAMYRLNGLLPGSFIPFARYEHYRGGWKAALQAPRLETDDLEFGFEWAPVKPVELTLSYARMERREADERRSGRAKGDVVRAQVQWNY